jgi:hypothetical protein
MVPVFTPWELRERGDTGSTPQTMHEVIISQLKINISRIGPKNDRGLIFLSSMKKRWRAAYNGQIRGKKRLKNEHLPNQH